MKIAAQDLKITHAALTSLKELTSNPQTIQIEIDGKKLIARRLRSGGFKTIYDIANGEVIALRKVDIDSVCESMAADWIEAVYAEKNMADKLKSLGLKSQDFDVVQVRINNYFLPALKMPSFSKMAQQGKEVKDYKNIKDRFGKSIIFGNLMNVENKDYLQQLAFHTIHDIVILVSEGLKLDDDSINFIVEVVTPESANENNSTNKTSNQLRLFFYDFWQKSLGIKAPLQICDSDGNLNSHLAKKLIMHYVNKFIDFVFASLSDDEVKTLIKQMLIDKSLPKLSPDDFSSYEDYETALEIQEMDQQDALHSKIEQNFLNLVFNPVLNEMLREIEEKIAAKKQAITSGNNNVNEHAQDVSSGLAKLLPMFQPKLKIDNELTVTENAFSMTKSNSGAN